jgi:hypothetical protein
MQIPRVMEVIEEDLEGRDGLVGSHDDLHATNKQQNEVK